MYDIGEIVVGGVLLASAGALVYASDFNRNVINKSKKETKNVRCERTK